MKGILAAVAMAGFAAAPAIAQTGHATPHQAVTLEQWTKRMQQELDKTIVYPQAMMGSPLGRGIVRVKFNCSEDGHPDKVSLAKSSGHREFDRAAIKAVQKIVSLHPLPDGMGGDQVYQAVVMFDTVADSNHWRRMDEINAEAAKRNAWFKQPARNVELTSR